MCSFLCCGYDPAVSARCIGKLSTVTPCHKFPFWHPYRTRNTLFSADKLHDCVVILGGREYLTTTDVRRLLGDGAHPDRLEAEWLSGLQSYIRGHGRGIQLEDGESATAGLQRGLTPLLDLYGQGPPDLSDVERLLEEAERLERPAAEAFMVACQAEGQRLA